MMMKVQANQIAKGVGIGLAVGGAVGLVGGAMRQPSYKRMAKKGLNKVVKTVGSVINAVS